MALLLASWVCLTVASANPNIVKDASPSVVRVLNVLTVDDATRVRNDVGLFRSIDLESVGVPLAFGSGFIVNKDGDVVTNYHVVERPNNLDVMVKSWLEMILMEAMEDEQQQGSVVRAIERELEANGNDKDKMIRGLSTKLGSLAASNAVKMSHYTFRRLKDGSVEMLEAKVLKRDRGADLAVLKVQGMKGAKPLTINVGPLLSGDLVCALGHPIATSGKSETKALMTWIRGGRYARDSNPKMGLRSYAEPDFADFRGVRTPPDAAELGSYKGDDEDSDVPLVFHDVQIGNGNSGGPLLNVAGQVVGVNTQVRSDESINRVSVATHASALSGLLQQWDIPCAVVNTRPSAPWKWGQIAMTSAVAILAVLAMVMAFLAFRRPVAPAIGRTTVLGWLDERSRLVRQNGGGGGSQVVHRYDPRQQRTQEVPRRTREVAPTEIMTTAHGDSMLHPSFELVAADPRREDGGGADAIRIALRGSDFARGDGQVRVGRSAEQSDVVINHRNISKQHALFRLRGGSLWVEDLGSSNGTWVNGKKLAPRTPEPVAPGDTVVLGKMSFRLKQIAGGRPRERAERPREHSPAPLPTAAAATNLPPPPSFPGMPRPPYA